MKKIHNLFKNLRIFLALIFQILKSDLYRFIGIKLVKAFLFFFYDTYTFINPLLFQFEVIFK